MTIILIIALVLCMVYGSNKINELRVELKKLKFQIYAERGLIRHFIGNSRAMAQDVKAYKELMLLADDPLERGLGQMEYAFYDKARFGEWLEEIDPVACMADSPGEELDKKIDELLRVKILKILNNIHAANPGVVKKHFADWFEKEEGYSYYSCLSWMIPEIEESLITAKIAIPEEFKELKNAVITGHLGELIPNLLEKAKESIRVSKT